MADEDTAMTGADARERGRQAFRGEWGNAAEAHDARIAAHISASQELQKSIETDKPIADEDKDRVFRDARHNLGTLIGDPAAIEVVANVREAELLGMYRNFHEATPETNPALAAQREQFLRENRYDEGAAWRAYAETRNFASVSGRLAPGAKSATDADRPIEGADPGTYFEIVENDVAKCGLVVTFRETLQAKDAVVGPTLLDHIDNNIREPHGLTPLRRTSQRVTDDNGRTRNTPIDRLTLTCQASVAGLFEHTVTRKPNARGDIVPQEGRSEGHIPPPTDDQAIAFVRTASYVRAHSGPEPVMMTQKAFVDAHGPKTPVRDVIANDQGKYSEAERGTALSTAKGYYVMTKANLFPGDAISVNAAMHVATLNRALGRPAFDPVAAYRAEKAGVEHVRTGTPPQQRAMVGYSMDGSLSSNVHRPIGLGMVQGGGYIDQVRSTPSPNRSSIRTLEQPGASAQHEPEVGDAAPAPAATDRSRSASHGVVFRPPPAAPAAGRGAGRAAASRTRAKDKDAAGLGA
jgi:hypothetical protein